MRLTIATGSFAAEHPKPRSELAAARVRVWSFERARKFGEERRA